MKVNKRHASKRHAIAARRARVGHWKKRQLSIRAITEKIEGEGFINDQGDPFTSTTIHKDVKYLFKQWEAAAAQSIATHKANQLAETREARRVAWDRILTTKDGDIYSQEDIGEIRRLIELEMKLTGTAAPAVSMIGGVDGSPLTVKGYTNVSPDDWGEDETDQ